MKLISSDMKIARIEVAAFIGILQEIMDNGIEYVDMILTEEEDRDSIDIVPLENDEDGNPSSINIITDDDINRLMLN